MSDLFTDPLHSAWFYPAALLTLSLAVALLEWWRPWRPEQRQLRPALLSDLVHLAINGHFFGVLLYGAAAQLQPAFQVLLERAGLGFLAHLRLAAAWPVWLQIVVALVVVDFLQWCVHRLLHRSSVLWEIHKVHHSIQDGEMDWLVSFRFHWLEVVVYKGLLYLPLLPFGFGLEAVLFHAVFGTLIGHLNHANLNLSWGPLRYVLNSPRMHIWHHDYDGDERTTKNFGIILSTWDWLFGTASLPAHPPARLGFAGVDRMPNNVLAHAVWPASESRGPIRGAAVAALSFLLAIVAVPALTPWLNRRVLPPTPAADAAAKPQASAGSQPAALDVAALRRAPDEATANLALFGTDAAERGYAHPEDMVSVAELAQAIGAPGLLILDVRPLARVRQGHIPGAQAIDRDDYALAAPIPGLARPTAELQSALRTRGVNRDSVVVLVGDGGPEPYRLWWQLRAHGLASRVLDGGLVAWKAQGLPTVDGDPEAIEPLEAGDVVLADVRLPLTWDELGERRGGAVFLDARSAAEFDGSEQHQDAARAGHIPGAVLLPWHELLRSERDQRLFPVAALRARFAAAGVDDGVHVISYCQTGTRSALLTFALRQLGKSDDDALNYNGSWAEYSRLASLPVALNPPR